MTGALPFVDEHAIELPAPPERVWPELQRYVDRGLRRAAGSPLTRILGTRPRAGFTLAGSMPPRRMTLAGRHRFARYELVLELAEAPDGTMLTARTYAAFPGLHGRAYRVLVIGTRGHVLATRLLLRRFRDSVDWLSPDR